ncbi:UDP-glucosyltransferase 2-like [Cydia fagiglandana]|uniref:UDP-glucosyltransferase 2-like n=1 Tax=Cydia fagiglandana TaxID=1458189 RepID=UPI002FEE579C
MKSISLAFTLLIALAHTANALNILGIFPYHGTSHFLVFRVYLLGLVNKGHNVTVISHFPEKNPPPNYHSISLAGTLEILKDDMPIEKSYKTIFNTGLFLTSTGKENCEVMLKNKRVRDLVDSKAKFDVIIIEQFNSDCAFGIAYKLNAPVVGMMSHILMPWHYRRLGIPYNTAYVPFHFLEGGSKPTLYQRIERLLFDVYFRTLYYFVTQRSDQKTLAQYYDDIPPLEDLAREMKFLLVYHNFVLTGSRLFPPNVIEVGGYHVARAKSLAGALKTFVEGAKHGVVYISFGSVLNPTSLSPEKVQAILDVMAQLPQRFIWKWSNKTLAVAQDKLYTGNWLPQIDILGHPNTLAFFSHAGMGGTTEAIHYGVPMVAMPVLGDQPANGAAIEESGLGVQVQIRDLNKENLLAAFRKVLDPKFREKVKQISKAWHDRPMRPLDTAIYWTEYAARHRNFTFRAAAADTPLYQHFYLDIIGVLVISLYVIAKVFSLLLGLCNSKASVKNVKTIDKKTSKKSKRE